jgi:hypothetical protein
LARQFVASWSVHGWYDASFAGNRRLHPFVPLSDFKGKWAVANARKNPLEGESKKDRSKSEDDKLDEALEETFPASDAPSMTDPAKHVGGGEKTRHPSGRATQDKNQR